MPKIKNLFKKKPKVQPNLLPNIIPCTPKNDIKTSTIERACGQVKTTITCVDGSLRSVGVHRPNPCYYPPSIYSNPTDDLLIIPSDYSKEEKSILIDNLIQLLFEVKGYL